LANTANSQTQQITANVQAFSANICISVNGPNTYSAKNDIEPFCSLANSLPVSSSYNRTV